ncbi:MAG: transcription-repair coupling factor [Armatimonadetes bacterium]|nr:transcription-repair coupling factor [Armatimonadota bacterium]
MPLAWLLDQLLESPEFSRAAQALRHASQPVWIEGLAGSAKTCVLAGLARYSGRAALVITASEEAAERLAEDLPAFGFRPEEIGLYPASEPELEDLLAEKKMIASSEAPEQRALARTRLAVLEGLAEGRLSLVVAPVHAALRATLGPLCQHRLTLQRGQTADLHRLARQLVEFGYQRAALVEVAGQFALRGGILDVFPSTRAQPVRIEWFGDEIEGLREFDVESQRSLQEMDALTLLPARELLEAPASERGTFTLLEHMPPGCLVVLDEPGHARIRWQEYREQVNRREALLQESDRVLPEHVAPSRARAEHVDLERWLERLAPYRRLVFTLLGHSLPWLRQELAGAVHAGMNSGSIDSAQGDLPELATRLRSWIGAGNRVVVISDRPGRVTELLVEQGIPARDASRREPSPEAGEGAPRRDSLPSPNAEEGPGVAVHQGRLSAGFRLPGLKRIVLTDAEIFGGGPEHRPRPQRVAQKFKESRPIMSLLELKEGDLVVHVVHGIGRYRGLERRSVNGVQREFLRIDYQEPDRLFVPSDQLDRVQKYIGSDDQPPTIHRLGGGDWFRTKSRVRARVKEMAKQLVALYAARQARPGYAFDEDTVWQEELEAAFPYQETKDQLQAIWDTKRDMHAPRPMDRLVCGDVGYGKTEVAIRAAFKAVVDGKQAAVLVPTTVLAQQHYVTFTERLAAFPVNVEVLSRFRTRAEQKEIVRRLAEGDLDIVIGTHRLLSKDVQLSDLGLLVVDEEHRFGVSHKERIKQLKQSVDVLTLTATPIPRTLHMSLAGIRDMSVIEDPPEGRLAVRTYCLEWDPTIIREAILRELDRGGQVYYVHNRIETIFREAEKLRRLVPQARIRAGHGQMSADELEEVMLDFYEHQYDILVCTTIIESGLDIPNVNTIVITEADRLGLAQLHQLRGRVGRSSRQAYCYLTYQPFKVLTETAEKRLEAIRDFTDLGAGFRIAMRDLEIRGAGNLLGPEQHGFMVAVGFELYCQMIEEAVKEIQGKSVEEVLLPGVNLPINAFLPPEYVPTDGLRLAFYRKIAACREPAHVDAVQAEMEDRFGDPPTPVWHLLALMRLRMACLEAGVGRIETDKQGIVLWMARRVPLEDAKAIQRKFRRTSFLPDRIVLHYEGDNPLRAVENLVAALKERAGKSASDAVRRQLAAEQALSARG